jgi:hypothetical protein
LGAPACANGMEPAATRPRNVPRRVRPLTSAGHRRGAARHTRAMRVRRMKCGIPLFRAT